MRIKFYIFCSSVKPSLEWNILRRKDKLCISKNVWVENACEISNHVFEPEAYFYKFSIIIFLGAVIQETHLQHIPYKTIYMWKEKGNHFLYNLIFLYPKFCMYRWIGFIFLRIFIFFSSLLLFFLFSLFYKKIKKKNLYIRVLYSRSIKLWMYIIEKRKEIDRWAKKRFIELYSKRVAYFRSSKFNEWSKNEWEFSYNFFPPSCGSWEMFFFFK